MSLELLIEIWKDGDQDVTDNLKGHGLQEHEAIMLEAILEIRDNLRKLLARTEPKRSGDGA